MSGRTILYVYMLIMMFISCNSLDYKNRKPFVLIKDLQNCSESLIDKGFFFGVTDVTTGMDSLFWLIYNESSSGNYSIMVALNKNQSWQDVLIIQPDIKRSVKIFNPRIWMDPDERIWIFWTKQVKHSYEIWALTGDSGTNDLVRSKPFFISDGILMGKPVLLSNGKFMLSASMDNRIYTIASFDHGKTWHHEGMVELPEEAYVNEAVCSITECQNSSLWMVIQTPKGTWESQSTEQGLSWNRLVASNISSTGHPFFIQKLISGNILLVKQKEDDISALTAFVSYDNGQTWSGGLILDQIKLVSYISGTQRKEVIFPCCAEISIIYGTQQDNKNEIRMIKFTEDDVITGQIRHYSSPFR